MSFLLREPAASNSYIQTNYCYTDVSLIRSGLAYNRKDRMADPSLIIFKSALKLTGEPIA